MGPFCKCVQNPINNYRKKCVESCNNTKPPGDDQAAAWMLGQVHNPAGYIFRGHTQVNDAVDSFAGTMLIKMGTKLSFSRSGINTRDLDSKGSNLAPQGIGKGSDAI